MHIRAAQPGEAGLLSRLAIASKAHWGYPEEWLEQWTDELSVAPGEVAPHFVHLAEEEGQVVGFYSLIPLSKDTVDLGHLFVLPGLLGRGIGRQLFEHLTALASSLGYRRLLIVSDPYAATFYEHCGAARTGEQPSKISGRNLPVYEFLLPTF